MTRSIGRYLEWESSTIQPYLLLHSEKGHIALGLISKQHFLYHLSPHPQNTLAGTFKIYTGTHRLHLKYIHHRFNTYYLQHELTIHLIKHEKAKVRENQGKPVSGMHSGSSRL